MSDQANWNDLSDVERELPTEELARLFLFRTRWGQWPSCPFCGNERAYFISTRSEYKCASKVCRKKFSITTRTLIQDRKLPYSKLILIAFIYAKTKGRCMPWDLEKSANINFTTAQIIKDKLDYCWPCVLTENRSIKQIVEDLFKTMFSLYDKYQLFTRKKYEGSWGEQFVGINDISNPQHYSKLIYYIRCHLYYTKYFFCHFAEPEDILAETFLYLKEKKIGDYDSNMLIKYINRTATRMFTKFLKEHPKLNRYPSKWQREHKERSRRTLMDGYLVEIIKGSKKYGSTDKTRGEIRKDKSLIETCRRSVLEYRVKNLLLTDFVSHFD